MTFQSDCAKINEMISINNGLNIFKEMGVDHEENIFIVAGSTIADTK